EVELREQQRHSEDQHGCEGVRIDERRINPVARQPLQDFRRGAIRIFWKLINLEITACLLQSGEMLIKAEDNNHAQGQKIKQPKEVEILQIREDRESDIKGSGDRGKV